MHRVRMDLSPMLCNRMVRGPLKLKVYCFKINKPYFTQQRANVWYSLLHKVIWALHIKWGDGGNQHIDL